MSGPDVPRETSPVFTVVWEFCKSGDENNPNASWRRIEKTFDNERDAVHAWGSARLHTNTRPVSIDPEPDWSRYTYDGRTPGTK